MQVMQRPSEADILSTGIIFDGNALQNITVFVSRKGHLFSFISAPLFLRWNRFPRSPSDNRLCVPWPRPHRRDDRQNDERDSNDQVSHLSHPLPQGPLPAHLSTASAMPVAFQVLWTPDNSLFFKGNQIQEPAISRGGWKS